MTLAAPRSARWSAALTAAAPERIGSVRTVVGLSVEVAGVDCPVGGLVRIGEGEGVLAEVVATTRDTARCMPLGQLDGLRAGTPVRSLGRSLTAPVGHGLLGRVLDGLGRPIDGKGPLVDDRSGPDRQHGPERHDRASASTPRSASASRSWTPSRRSAAASAWACSPAPVSASRPCCR